MKHELYRRWLDDSRGLTLEEFVAERRAEVRQARAQRRFSREMGPLLQQSLRHSAAMQQQLAAQYQVNPQLALNRASLLGGIFGNF